MLKAHRSSWIVYCVCIDSLIHILALWNILFFFPFLIWFHVVATGGHETQGCSTNSCDRSFTGGCCFRELTSMFKVWLFNNVKIVGLENDMNWQ